MEIHQILTQYWGYNRFRPLQEDIIRAVMNGKDCLALLPTGGGKSICYQVPAMAMEGITIVISPLIALMKDQTEALQQKKIQAKVIFSGMSYREIDTVLDNCIYGKTKLLYLSPERLSSDLVRTRIAKMKVSLLAVDEAHCISQWGYDFRPGYLKIAEFRDMHPKVPVLALTATATENVMDDIMTQLKFREKKVLRKSFSRSNLAYHVMTEEDKNGRLLKLCREMRGTGIVYVRTRKGCRDVASLMKRAGIKAEYYHAGLTREQRTERQNAWMQDRLRIMVSTNAFGMGIDKPNVRWVIHMDMPDRIESYMQEAGRAGRDEKPAQAVLLYSPADRLSLLERIHTSYPALAEIRKVYHALGNFFQVPVGSGENTAFEFDMSGFCRQFELKADLVYHSLLLLERAGYLTLVESIHQPSRIRFTASRQALYNYQVSHQSMDAFIKLLLRSYPGLFDDFVPIREEDLARHMKADGGKVQETLMRLQKEDILEYLPRSEAPRIVFDIPRQEEKNLIIAPEFLKTRKELAIRRAEAMIFYVTSETRCRSLLLLSYFGEKGGKRCGICDVCTERNDLNLNDLEFEQVSSQLKSLLGKHSYSLTDLVAQVQGSREDRIVKVVQWLMDHGKIRYNQENQLTWVS